MLTKLIMDPNGSASGIMFEAYVLRAFREGGHIFELKDLETGQSARLEIPRNPAVTHFSTVAPVAAGTLCIPKICNYACVDLLLAPRDLFQITVSRNHPIKGPPLSKLLDSLIQASWTRPEDARLIFVVPSHIYANFEKQNYLTSDRKVYRTVPAEILRVKQYVLKIDLESAAAGKSPGLQIPITLNKIFSFFLVAVLALVVMSQGAEAVTLPAWCNCSNDQAKTKQAYSEAYSEASGNCDGSSCGLDQIGKYSAFLRSCYYQHGGYKL
ncbi:hypothetical protein BGZ88_012438 [Linnemannia elongata]|nr:hypothetical protein BGZ88_012438 [Linnemannia elongata]